MEVYQQNPNQERRKDHSNEMNAFKGLVGMMLLGFWLLWKKKKTNPQAFFLQISK